jgi:hypothetical protein
VSKFADIRAITRKVRVLDTEAEVTTVQTSKTVFEAYGKYKDKNISAKAGSRPAALARWRHLAERSED